MMPKKLLLLIALTITTVVGMLLQTSDSPSLIRYLFAGTGLIFIPIISAWIGIDGARAFTFKSVFGKSLLFISLGVLAWGLGDVAFFYYNISGTEVPYPSLADVGYIALIPLVSYGVFLLLKGVKMKLDAKTIFKILISPILVLLVIFPFFIYGKLAEDVDLLTKTLNVLYPVGDVLFLSFALIIITLTYGSVLFKSLRIISLGFIIEAMADFSFSYATAAGIYYTSSWDDVLFALAFFTIGFGMYYMSKSLKEPAKKQSA